MDVAVGKGRAVVQHKALAAGVDALHTAVEVALGPLLQRFRLLDGQIGAHGEVGRGQVERILIISHSVSSLSVVKSWKVP